MQIELKLRKCKKEDLKTINQWNKDWDDEAPEFPDWYFPEDVYIIDGVISASYYKTNSKVSYIENIISNKYAPQELRQAGLALIGNYIFNQAKSDGFNVMLGWTNHPSVSKISKENGMIATSHDFSLLFKPLVINSETQKLINSFQEDK